MGKTEAKQQREEREHAGELAQDPDALAREDVVAKGRGVEVVDTELRPVDLARHEGFSPLPAVRDDVVYGTCSMCRNAAPHSGPENVSCPRCGLQPARL